MGIRGELQELEFEYRGKFDLNFDQGKRFEILFELAGCLSYPSSSYRGSNVSI